MNVCCAFRPILSLKFCELCHAVYFSGSVQIFHIKGVRNFDSWNYSHMEAWLYEARPY